MSNLLIIGYVINLIFINFAFGVGGLLLGVVFSVGVYLFGIKTLNIKGPKNEARLQNFALGTVYLVGIFAAAKLYDNPALTFAAFMVEGLVYIIFISIH